METLALWSWLQLCTTLDAASAREVRHWLVFYVWRSKVCIPCLMQRLHQDTYRPETCVLDEQHASGYICRRTRITGYILLVRDTCWLYLGDIITIHLCHGRLVSLATDGRQTGNSFVADTIRHMLTATSGYNWMQLVSGNIHVSWCKRGLTVCRASLSADYGRKPILYYGRPKQTTDRSFC